MKKSMLITAIKKKKKEEGKHISWLRLSLTVQIETRYFLFSKAF